MAKSVKGIWRYIDKRKGSKNWQFYKRFPVDVAGKLGQEFDRFSLKTSNDALAEIRARQALQDHEVKVQTTRKGMPFFDVAAKAELSDLSPQETEAFDMVLSFFNDFSFSSSGNEGITPNILTAYQSIKKEDQSENFDKVLRESGIIASKDSHIFKLYLEKFHIRFRQLVANLVKVHNVATAENTDDVDLDKFETKIFEADPNQKRPAPMITVNRLWDIYLKERFPPEEERTKRQVEEINRFQKYVKHLSSFTNDPPINYLTNRQVIAFFKRLENYPAKPTKIQLNMTFEELTSLSHGQRTITITTSNEYFSRLSRLFKFAVISYRDEYSSVRNPLEGMKKTVVKGRDATVKRPWMEDEIASLMSLPEFTDPKLRNSFFYSVLCALHHGNRLSEFHGRTIDQLKQDKKGIWHIEIGEAKNLYSSNRVVPIHEHLIKCGFLQWVEVNRKAGAQYLFPDENHDDPDSREFSKNFGRFLKRKGLNAPVRTLHNFRDTFITATERAKMRSSVARKIAGHAPLDIHEDYKYIYLDTMKEAIDTVRIEGFPYDIIK